MMYFNAHSNFLFLKHATDSTRINHFDFSPVFVCVAKNQQDLSQTVKYECTIFVLIAHGLIHFKCCLLYLLDHPDAFYFRKKSHEHAASAKDGFYLGKKAHDLQTR